MTDWAKAIGQKAEMAAPLHLQRLKRGLNAQPFLNQVKELFKDPIKYNICYKLAAVGFFYKGCKFISSCDVFSDEEESSEEVSVESD